MPTDPLYETDFYAWSKHQATLLREGHITELDVENVVEELETLGRSERHALESRLEVLVAHLLKWCYQAERQESHRSWRLTILEQRRRLTRLVSASPSLRPTLSSVLAESYDYARRLALEETGLQESALPLSCPWAILEILDDDFWPAE